MSGEDGCARSEREREREKNLPNHFSSPSQERERKIFLPRAVIRSGVGRGNGRELNDKLCPGDPGLPWS